MYGKDLNINRQKRQPFGFKAHRMHRRQLVGSGEKKPGEMINIKFSGIKGEVTVPGSAYLSFKAKITGSDKTAYFVPNLGRALVKEKELKFSGAKSTSATNYDEFKIYSDLWLEEKERREKILQGIQDELGLKYRIDAKKDSTGTALANVTAKHKAIKEAYENTFVIPLDEELFDDQAPFYRYALNNDVELALKLSNAGEVVISTDKAASYELFEIHLEWDAIQDHDLADEIEYAYQSGVGVYYDRAHFYAKVVEKSSPLINIEIKESVRSLRGVLLLFKDIDADQKQYAMNRETFYNPKIESVTIDLNGDSNMRYASGMLTKDIWSEARKYFQGSTGMSQEAFYNDKFALWIDLRSSTDPELHGNGLLMDNSKGNLTLNIHKKAEGTGKIRVYTYLIMDAVLELGGNEGAPRYQKLTYAL